MRYLGLALCAIGLSTFVGCGRTPESLIARQISILDETAETLSTIRDDASATRAAPKLSKLQRELNGLVPKVKALNLTDETKKQLEEQHQQELDKALAKYQTELDRVRKLNLKVGGLSALDDAIVE
jgi:hypothetical protein